MCGDKTGGVRMRLGIMQPYFFPYIGYISLIKHVDEFILLDEVQFIRHGWIDRNRIASACEGWHYIHVPLQKHHQTTLIKDIRINNNLDWEDNIIRQLSQYSKAPYYMDVIDVMGCLFAKQYDDIVSLNLVTIMSICDYLCIETPVKVFSKMDVKIDPVNTPDEWALNICKSLGANEYYNPPGGMALFDRDKYADNGIDIKFLKANNIGSGLSIIDVMMFNSPDEINEMLDDYELL